MKNSFFMLLFRIRMQEYLYLYFIELDKDYELL